MPYQPYHAGNEMISGGYISIIYADGLAPCVGRSSADMIFTVHKHHKDAIINQNRAGNKTIQYTKG